MGLTIKQEKYVQELIKGRSQRAAYNVAYPTSVKWKESSVDCEAAKLMANPKVLQRYNELNKKHQDKAIMTKDELLRGLKKAFYMCLGIEATPMLLKEVIEGKLEVLEEKYRCADLKSVATIAGQITKLEGWDNSDSKQEPVNINITMPEAPNPGKV